MLFAADLNQVFTSDGINERRIPREYCSDSNEKIIDVNDIYFFSNQSSSTVYVVLPSHCEIIKSSKRVTILTFVFIKDLFAYLAGEIASDFL